MQNKDGVITKKITKLPTQEQLNAANVVWKDKYPKKTKPTKTTKKDK